MNLHWLQNLMFSTGLSATKGDPCSLGHAVTRQDCWPDGKTTYIWDREKGPWMERACPRCGETVAFPTASVGAFPPMVSAIMSKHEHRS